MLRRPVSNGEKAVRWLRAHTSRAARFVRRCSEGARHLLARSRVAVYAEYDVVLLVKVLDATPPPRANPQLRVETAGSRHIPRLVKLTQKHFGWDLTELNHERIESGAGALLAFLGDELVGYLWWADVDAMARVEPLLPIRYGIELQPDDVYGFDLFVAPEHRGDGTATWCLANFESELERLGYARMQSYAVRSNRAARWLFEISGHETVRRLQSKVLISRLLRVDGSMYWATPRGFRRLW